MSTAHRIRVLVQHCDPVAQAGLSATFSRYADLEVQSPVAEPGDTPPLSGTPGRCLADVVVADYSQGVALAMQGGGSPNANGWPKILIVAGNDRECEIRSALERGVRGYVLVGCALDELVAGVRAVRRSPGGVQRGTAPQPASSSTFG